MKSNSSSFLRNSIFISFSLLIRAVTNFLIGVGIARFYGPESFGQFSIAYTVSNICLTLADFGFDVLLTTEIASKRNEADRITNKYLSIKVLLTLISALLMIGLATVLPLSNTSKNFIYALVLFMAFTTIINFFFAFFRGFEKFHLETKVSFIMNFFLLISIAVLGIFRINLFYLIALFVVSRIIGFIICYNDSKKLSDLKFQFDFSEIKIYLNRVLIYGLNFLFGNLFLQLDTVIIGSILGDVQAGIYRAAFWILIMFLMASDVVISAVLPSLSKSFTEDKSQWNFLGKIIFKILFVIAIPISITLYFFPDFIIHLIYGKEKFNEAIKILQIFSFVIFIRFFVEPFGLIITTSQRQIIRSIIVIIATFLILVFNYLFAVKYGLISVAYIALFVNAFVGLGYIIGSKINYKDWLFNYRNIFMMFSTLILIFSAILLKSIILIVTISLLYFYLAYLFYFDNDDKKFLFQLINTKKVELS